MTKNLSKTLFVYIWGSNSLLPQQSQKTIGPTGSAKRRIPANPPFGMTSTTEYESVSFRNNTFW